MLKKKPCNFSRLDTLLVTCWYKRIIGQRTCEYTECSLTQRLYSVSSRYSRSRCGTSTHSVTTVGCYLAAHAYCIIYYSPNKLLFTHTSRQINYLLLKFTTWRKQISNRLYSRVPWNVKQRKKQSLIGVFIRSYVIDDVV